MSREVTFIAKLPRRSIARAQRFEIVDDVMTQGTLYSVKPDDTVDHALQLLVQHRVTGLPVVDEQNKVIGVVSDFDLLALDTLGRTNEDKALFPSADQTWQAFKEVKKLVAKSAGKKVKDVMTAQPITARKGQDLEEAVRLLLTKKIHRLPVVDSEGRLAGVLSRGNVVKAALAARKAVMEASA